VSANAALLTLCNLCREVSMRVMPPNIYVTFKRDALLGIMLET